MSWRSALKNDFKMGNDVKKPNSAMVPHSVELSKVEVGSTRVVGGNPILQLRKTGPVNEKCGTAVGKVVDRKSHGGGNVDCTQGNRTDVTFGASLRTSLGKLRGAISPTEPVNHRDVGVNTDMTNSDLSIYDGLLSRQTSLSSIATQTDEDYNNWVGARDREKSMSTTCGRIGYTNTTRLHTLLEKYSSFQPVFMDRSVVCTAKVSTPMYGTVSCTDRWNLNSYLVNNCTLKIYSRSGSGCASLAMKAVLFSLCCMVLGEQPIRDDWFKVVGTRSVKDVNLLGSRERELLRIINQPYPYHENAGLKFTNVMMEDSGLDIERPQKNWHWGPGVWVTVWSLFAKLGASMDLEKAICDVVGLCEYLDNIGARTCQLTGACDGDEKIVVRGSESTPSDGMLGVILMASVICGDELSLIHSECSDKMRRVEQWHALLRCSHIYAEGNVRDSPGAIARAILCSKGFELAFMPDNKHCGLDADSKVMLWLYSSEQHEMEYYEDYYVIDKCARVIRIANVEECARLFGHWTLEEMIDKKEYKNLCIAHFSRGVRVWSGKGTANINIYDNGNRIGIISRFGRYLERVGQG